MGGGVKLRRSTGVRPKSQLRKHTLNLHLSETGERLGRQRGVRMPRVRQSAWIQL